MKREMKKINKKIFMAALTVMGMLGCSDEFLNRPPEDTLVDASFYKTDEQILLGTAPLYSAVWKSYIDQANFKLGDMRGGTLFRAWNDRAWRCSRVERDQGCDRIIRLWGCERAERASGYE